jgi:quercetin dioxygenase-like cupin family protein
VSRSIFTAVLATAAAVGLAVAADSPSSAKAPQTHIMKSVSDMQWGEGPPSLPPGIKVTMLEGDPAKEGFFAMRIKMPAGYTIPPHFHPTVERVTVIEGTFQLGMGDKVDESKYQSFPAGSYLSMPTGMHHFAKAKTDVVVQIATNGPWGITYLNPADDPRNAKKPTN